MSESGVRPNMFGQLLSFLAELDRRSISYRLSKESPDAIMVHIFAPGERWEVEFMQQSRIAVERFKSTGRIHDESVFDELWELSRNDIVPSFVQTED